MGIGSSRVEEGRKVRKGFLDFKLNQQDIQLLLVSLRCGLDSVLQSTWNQPYFPWPRNNATKISWYTNLKLQFLLSGPSI